jgi:spore maturation protein CgeB
MFSHKNILLVGSKEEFTLENMYLRAFKKIGLKVTLYHSDNSVKNIIGKFFEKYLSSIYYLFVRKKFLNFFFKNKKKYDLVIVFKGLFFNKEIIKKIKKEKIKIVNIFPDDPLNTQVKNISNKNLVDSIEDYDLFCLWSQKIIKKILQFKPKSHLYYLPFGYDEFVHKKVAKKKKYINTINFIGSYDLTRLDYLKKIKFSNLIIAGNNWKDHIKNENNYVFGKKLCSVISSSLISINLLRDQNQTSHNMRTFEIPAMGGLLLTKRSNEQNKFFPENKASIMYANKKEFVEKINFILKNKSKMKKIRNLSYKLSKKHSYTNRAINILKRLNDS